MKRRLRQSEPSDMPFLREMLYEGVYWRAIANATNPPFEEGLTASGVRNALVNWGEREGDVAVVALVDSHRAGAAWYRFYTDDNSIRGYIDDTIPALVMAVHKDYRRQGIGKHLIEWLIDYASTHNIQQISLMVSKDNHAIHLYRKCGFHDYADRGDSLVMLRKITREHHITTKGIISHRLLKEASTYSGDTIDARSHYVKSKGNISSDVITEVQRIEEQRVLIG